MCRQKTGLTELLGNHDGTSSVICHPLFSLSPGPGWRASSVSPCPHRQTHKPSNMMDDGSAHTSLTLSAVHDSIYTYNITSEHCLPSGSQCCPHSDHFYEQIDRCGTRMFPFHSCPTTLILKLVLKCMWMQQGKTSISILKYSLRHESEKKKKV